MLKYACKYCGGTTDDMYNCSCANAEAWIGVNHCFWVLNEGPVQCANCGATADSVEDLCRSSCSNAKGGSFANNHVAAR